MSSELIHICHILHDIHIFLQIFAENRQALALLSFLLTYFYEEQTTSHGIYSQYETGIIIMIIILDNVNC